MKKLTLVFVALGLVSCNKYKIEGTVNDVKDGAKVFLVTSNEMGGPVPTDTVEVKGGKFEFEGKAEFPEIAFITTENQNQGNVPLVLENGSIEVNYDTKDPLKSFVNGTDNNDLYAKFNNDNKDIIKKAKKINDDNILVLTKKPETDDDRAKLQVVMNQFNELQKEMDVRSKKFIKENPESFVTVLLVENLFFKGVFTGEECKKIYDTFPDKLKNTKSGKSIKKFLDVKLANEKSLNAKATKDFSAKTPDGKTVTLKQSMGKVTIIDFWASWCAPCRQENPNVVKIYNEFHAKGLNIVGVSLDEDASKWKAAIEKDQLTWTQVSNLKGWKDPIAKQFDVNEIPKTFILDEKGNVVAQNLKGEELRAKIKELLEKK